LKIIVLGTRGFPNVQGGIEAHCEHLYPFLVQNGCDVTILSRTPYVDPAIHFYKDVKLIPISCPKSKYLETIIHTFKGIIVAKRLGCDVLHIHGIGPSLCIPFARFLGLKVVMTHHGPDYMRKKWNYFAKFILKSGELFSSKFANAIICISEIIADSIRKKYKREPTVIPNGVEIPQVMTSDHAQKEYGLEKGMYILTVGRYVPEKGFHDLIDSYAKMRIIAKDRGMNTNGWKLVIVGDADHEDEYSKWLRAKSEGAVDVILTGRLTGQSLQELYAYAGLFVLPSYFEGLPIVLLEAMSYGLSCIVSDIPANREIDLDEDRYFKPGDIDALATKIVEKMQKPLNPIEWKKQIDLITEKYNWEKIAKNTLNVYTILLA